MRPFPFGFPAASARLFPAAAGLFAACAANAQEAVSIEQDQAGSVEESVIYVIAQRTRGSVDVPQLPVLELGVEEIAAYGSGSIQELLEALAPQTGSGRGRGGGSPVMLVNGKRISSFREIRSYPPEAIEKVEVFSEEVAQSFGYSPDQRVVNIILKPNYASREIELEYGWPSAGGYSVQEAEATLLRIDGPRRLNVNLEYNRSGMLTEAERGIVQAAGTLPDVPGDAAPAEFRSLVSGSDAFEATANWTMPLGAAELGLNGTLEYAESTRLQGLDTVVLAFNGVSALRSFDSGDPLTVDARDLDLSAGATLNASPGDWQVTATLDASRSNSRRRIARRADTAALVADAATGLIPIDGPLPALPDAGADQARTLTSSLSAMATGQSKPLLLPAGEVSLTLDGGFDWQRIAGRDTRSAGSDAVLQRGDASGGINIGIPLTSRRDNFASFLGDLSANLSAGINHLSDFGTLTDWSAGLTWELFDPLQLSASFIARDAAPSLAQLGEAEIATPNVQVFDFTNGETVNVTVLSGGNPLLPSQTQRDWKLGANIDLPVFSRSNLSIEYFDNTSRNVAAGFPLLTPAIEAIFPDRIARDGSGTLVTIDQRPVAFARQEARRIQLGLNLSGELGGSSPADPGGDRRPSGGTAGGSPASGGPRLPGFGRGGADGGRWFTNLTYKYEIANEVLVAPGGPLLDQLEGEALSGDVPRHSANLRAGLFKNGYGLRIDGAYTGRSNILGSGTSGSSDIYFDDYFTLDLRLFADLSQRAGLLERLPFLKNTRLSFDIENIFDTRQAVVDGTGAVPLRYQPYLVDPVGRSFEVELRKIF